MSLKNAVAVERMRATPMVKMTCSARNTGNNIIGPETGTRYQSIMIGRNTDRVRRYCARLNRTEPIGRIALGNRTLFKRDALSTMAPVDIEAELAKKDHASCPSIK